MTIRPARPEDGPAIGKLFAQEPETPMFDWTTPGLASWWLVAVEDDDAVVGAIQVSTSLPAGSIGDLIVAESHRRAGVAWALWKAAEAILVRAGCQWVSAAIRGRWWWTAAVSDKAGFVAHPDRVMFMRKDLR